MKKPDISIVIPSYGQKKTILKTLESIYNNKTGLLYEVIVVDSSPDDMTSLIRKGYPKTKVIHLDERAYSGKATEIGVLQAKAEIILRTDTDVIVTPDWIDRMHDRLKHYDIVGGGMDNANPDNLLGWSIFLTEFSGFLSTGKKKETTNIMTCNAGFRKSICREGSGFPPYRASTDLYFCWYHKNRGAKILFDPSVKVLHINKVDLAAIINTQYWIGRGSAWTRRKLNLPGKILVNYPMLAFGLPFFRFFSILSRLLNSYAKYTLIYLLLSPLIFIVLCSYSAGFFKGCLDKDNVIGTGEIK